MKLAFELEVPEGAIDEETKKELLQAAKEQTILRLYAEERITTGEAAELLGLTRIQFLNLLQQRGVPFTVDLEDEDFQMLRRWNQQRAPKSSS